MHALAKKQQNWRTSDVIYNVKSHSGFMDYNMSKANESRRNRPDQNSKKRDRNRKKKRIQDWRLMENYHRHLLPFLWQTPDPAALALFSPVNTHRQWISSSRRTVQRQTECVSLLPQQTPGPCCTPSVEISWPAQKPVNST